MKQRLIIVSVYEVLHELQQQGFHLSKTYLQRLFTENKVHEKHVNCVLSLDLI